MPEFGRTQYCLGAVVFTLKQTLFDDVLVSTNSEVTTSLNGPAQIFKQFEKMITILPKRPSVGYSLTTTRLLWNKS